MNLHLRTHFNRHRKGKPLDVLARSEIFALQLAAAGRARLVKTRHSLPPVEDYSLYAIRGTQETRHHNSLAGSSCVLRWRNGTDKGANARAAQHPRS